MNFEYQGCDDLEASEHLWEPSEDIRIYILVHIENITKKRTKGVELGGAVETMFKLPLAGEAKGNAGGKYITSWEWSTGWRKTQGRGFGAEAEINGGGVLDGSFFGGSIFELQEKSATVFGNLGSGADSEIYAYSPKKISRCPNYGRFGLRPNPYAINTPHIHRLWPF